MDLKQISWPMTISLWIIGHGVIEIPLGKPRQLLSILYTNLLLISYWYVVLFVMDKVDLLYFAKTNNIGVQIYRMIIHLNIGFILFMDILSWIRRKDLEVYFNRMNVVIKVMEQLSMKDNHWQHLQFQYIQYGILCFEILISFVCGIWFISGITICTKLVLSYGFFYPTVLLHVTDIYFVISVRYIGTKFEQMNKNLSDKLKTLSNLDGTYEHIQSEENFCNLIKAVRQIHLELVRLSQYLNQIFDVHLLISNSISVVLIISFLLNTYNILTGKIFDFEMYLQIIELINAQKTGGIVFKFYNFERSKEIRGEIEEFTMQLIQNPVSFTACDFLKLDYPFVFQIAASVTTYLVILIQMNNSITDFIQVKTAMPIQ